MRTVSSKSWLIVLGTLALAAIAFVTFGPGWSSEAGGKGGPGPARYSVIETEGSNLIVTDNQTNTVYFYTIDKDAEVGADLHLRGTLDLNQVGEATIKPKVISKKK